MQLLEVIGAVRYTHTHTYIYIYIYIVRRQRVKEQEGLFFRLFVCLKTQLTSVKEDCRFHTFKKCQGHAMR
jgi:hypothetical protein